MEQDCYYRGTDSSQCQAPHVGELMDDAGSHKKRIAIACQGGGSHTAFTAGVLKVILEVVHEKDDGGEAPASFDIVALSGASGGAMCALLSWFSLIGDATEDLTEPLETFWRQVALPPESWMSASAVHWARAVNTTSWSDVEVYLPSHPWLKEFARGQQKRLGKIIRDLVDPFPEQRNEPPLLYVSAADARSGKVYVFTSCSPDCRKNELPLNVEAFLASSAVPTVFPAVSMGEHFFWDSAFSQNPPIRQLHNANPDEIWIIQINPVNRSGDFTEVNSIKDRRNELAGNLSLEQEKYFIKKINEFVKRYNLGDITKNKYKEIAIKTIDIPERITNKQGQILYLDSWSKMDTSIRFINDLMEAGQRRAADFLRNTGEFLHSGFSSAGERYPSDD